MRLIDTHCHVYDERFPDPDAAIRQSLALGVEMIIVGTEPASWRQAIQLAESHVRVWAIVGWHPNYSAAYTTESMIELRECLAHPKVVALGEIGLDFHWDYATREQQDFALAIQLDLAAELDMPVVFHSREANPELLTVLEGRPPHPYLIHCFSGNAEEAQRAQALGAVIGLDGPLTYPKASELRQIAAGYSREKVVLETDSPYMAPVPYRGKTNRPEYVAFVNEELARVWGVSPEESARITTENAIRFFRLPG